MDTRQVDARRASLIAAAEATARDAVNTAAELLTNKINPQLSRTVLKLTWVAMATGILALVVSLVALAN